MDFLDELIAERTKKNPAFPSLVEERIRMKCGKHPKYQAKRKPTAKCGLCRKIYRTKNRRK